ncbi:MAG: acetyl-CoA carboxylase biotin carboxyl carrier protein [Nitrospirales bacterium]|nr:acetyl-CoA carboxylase biotin carboxyl carrier protein [Nitrospirales bacterium]
MKSDQFREIKELVEILDESHLTELEVERKDFRVRIKRDVVVSQGPPLPTVTARDESVLSKETAASAAPESSQFVTVTSPIVGTFYGSPSPETDSYVEEGDFVKKGQVICIVEAMKLMNEIESETDGRIVKILVENATSIEYGQPLFLIDPVAIPA